MGLRRKDHGRGEVSSVLKRLLSISEIYLHTLISEKSLCVCVCVTPFFRNTLQWNFPSRCMKLISVSLEICNVDR